MGAGANVKMSIEEATMHPAIRYRPELSVPA
jgi:hypothetical protein